MSAAADGVVAAAAIMYSVVAAYWPPRRLSQAQLCFRVMLRRPLHLHEQHVEIEWLAYETYKRR